MCCRQSPESLPRRLEAIDTAIAGHPFSSDVLVRLRAVFAESDGSGKGGPIINARLAEEGLPTIPRIWIFYARGFSSWWWLHNRRRAARRKVERHRDRRAPLDRRHAGFGAIAELLVRPSMEDEPVGAGAAPVRVEGRSRRRGVFRRRSRDELQRELDAIDAAMARHPHTSGRIERIDEIFAEGHGDGEVINERLAAEGLPTIPKLGRYYLRTLVSWLRLRRRRAVAVRRIERLEG